MSQSFEQGQLMIPPSGQVQCASQWKFVPFGIDIGLKIRALKTLDSPMVGVAVGQFFLIFCYKQGLDPEEVLNLARTILEDPGTESRGVEGV